MILQSANWPRVSVLDLVVLAGTPKRLAVHPETGSNWPRAANLQEAGVQIGRARPICGEVQEGTSPGRAMPREAAGANATRASHLTGAESVADAGRRSSPGAASRIGLQVGGGA